MYRKHNPYVSLVAILLLAVILAYACTGCAAQAESAETAPRFTVENAGNGCEIITDNETGVQYLYYHKSYNGYKCGSGLTKLEG
jgi:hypothetical protein